jgi:hypothetical protein
MDRTGCLTSDHSPLFIIDSFIHPMQCPQKVKPQQKDTLRVETWVRENREVRKEGRRKGSPKPKSRMTKTQKFVLCFY